MSVIIILPRAQRISPHDPDWIEQFERECAAVHQALREPPPRTRPIVARQREDR